MNGQIKPGSGVWLLTCSFTGAGTAFFGPFLPHLSSVWHLLDKQVGLLIACFFLGSFLGTLLLSRNLRRTLTIGSWTACFGFLTFAQSTHLDSGFRAALPAAAVMGFGLGQLMSSINLLVGNGPESERSKSLAALSAAWCAGAILSPVLTTVWLVGIDPSIRLSVLALLFLFPIVWARGRSILVQASFAEREQVSEQPPFGIGAMRLACLCTAAFLIYGGIEASVANWMPLYALRYSSMTLGAAQWIVSLFWFGLISGRMLTFLIVNSAVETLIVRAAIIGSSCCLAWLVYAPSSWNISIGSFVIGATLSPLFPLMLSAVIACRLSIRILGVVLAACGLGSALLSSLLGLISSLWSLRMGMLLPLIALGVLLIFFWQSPGYRHNPLSRR